MEKSWKIIVETEWSPWSSCACVPVCVRCQKGVPPRAGQTRRAGNHWSQHRSVCVDARRSASEAPRYKRRPRRHLVAC